MGFFNIGKPNPKREMQKAGIIFEDEEREIGTKRTFKEKFSNTSAEVSRQLGNFCDACNKIDEANTKGRKGKKGKGVLGLEDYEFKI